MKVCPLSREVILRIAAFNLYPLDYRAAFAFSILPIPAVAWACLAARFPLRSTSPIEIDPRENYGLTTFRMSARVG